MYDGTKDVHMVQFKIYSESKLMIIVTGGAGFIGSNLVKKLNSLGRRDIVVVDNLTNGEKFRNLVDCEILDYVDKQDFLAAIATYKKIDVVFHQGACSATTEWDGAYMLKNNYEYSKKLLNYCLKYRFPFIYASSAAVYGHTKEFCEISECECPLNVYGYSKLLFDQYVRRILSKAKSQIVGLRYFNVYGPREAHKKGMASVAFHLSEQLKVDDKVKLFEGSDGYAAGEQRRDFVYVADTVDVNLWFWQHPKKSGIFNCGTGKSRTFNDVARNIIAQYKKGEIEYIPFPKQLRDSYQSFTEANIMKLRKSGYKKDFKSLEEGIKLYVAFLSD